MWWKPECRASSIILMSPSKQWTSGSMHQAHKADTKNAQNQCWHISSFLWIRSTPLRLDLTSAVMLLFNYHIRAIISVISRAPINVNDGDHYKTLMDWKEVDKKYDALRNYCFIPVGSTVVVNKRLIGLWTCGTTIDKSDHSHNFESYGIQVTRTVWLITWNSKHWKEISIKDEQYLRKQLSK